MKHLSAILAIAILLTVGLACSDSGGNTAQPATTGSNDTAATKTSDAAVDFESVTLMNENNEPVTSFTSAEMTQKVKVKLSEFGKSRVKAVFTAVNAGGEKNMRILEKELETSMITNTADFTMTLDQPFPKGDYKLDVYLNDKLAKTVNYKVQ